MSVEREEYYTVDEVFETVEKKVETAEENGETIDYISFVPDGEPTLDKSLEEKIEAIKDLGFKVAVISNASLISHESVKEALHRADWVSLKMDAVSLDEWKKINRPHEELNLQDILDGVYEFSDEFPKNLNTETMLVGGVNDNTKALKNTADEIAEIGVDKNYIAIPTRPPAEDWARSPDEKKITEAYNIFKERGIDVEYLIGYEGDKFASSGDITEDLLSITSVHPMRERQVQRLLEKLDADWNEVYELVEERKLVETQFKGEKFYARKLDQEE